jgi:hypothetical protein
MAQVPYIPLYIGDWEQDTNCISLQAEAAWLKIVFKMFRNDKSGVYKTSTKSLQNLWKTDTNGVHDILNELIENNICDIEACELITFRNRRMIREKEISQVRSKAVQKRYKNPTKSVQNTEYEFEIDSGVESESKIVVKKEKAKPKKFVPPTLEQVRELAEIEMIGSKDAPETFFNYYEARGWMMQKTPMKNWKAAFRNWVKNDKNGSHKQFHGGQSTGETKTERDARAWEEFGKDYLEGRRTISTLFGFDENRTDAG